MPRMGTSQRRVLVLEGLGQRALCSETLAGMAISCYLVPAAGPGRRVPLRVPQEHICVLVSDRLRGVSVASVALSPPQGQGTHSGGSCAFGANWVPRLQLCQPLDSHSHFTLKEAAA